MRISFDFDGTLVDEFGGHPSNSQKDEVQGLVKKYLSSDISEIGLDSEVIPSDKLPLGEIDWAGFINREEAKLRLFHRSVPMLDKI